MLSVAEARARIVAGLHPTATEIVSLAEGLGRVLAEPIAARLTNPPRDMSAMDGYALAAAGVMAGATLRVVGSAPAGHPWSGRVGPGEAVRLFTGSVLPDGADTVVLQEDTAADGERVILREAPAPDRHIRRAGQDFAFGDTLLAAGQRLHARAIGLAAAGNHAWLRVHRRPRIAILATGDEVALPGDAIPEGGVVSSNGHALSALVRAAGGKPILLAVARDDRAALSAGAREARGADMLVTTGGASVGDHDLVRETLGGDGMALDFWKVAMRPGKPLLHGNLDGLPVLGLPGNPVSAIVTAILFLRPAIGALCGLGAGEPPTVLATLAGALPANDQRADHLRARLRPTQDGWEAAALTRQNSALVRALAIADCLILRAPHAPPARAGDTVRVIRFADLGI